MRQTLKHITISASAMLLASGMANLPARADDASVPAAPQFHITVPSVHGVGSSIDDATLKSILTGGLTDHAKELAALNAQSISIPEITITYQLHNTDGATAKGSFSYHNVELDNVANGVAATVTMESGASDMTESEMRGDVTMKFGKMSASQFNIGATLGLYGLVTSPQSKERTTLYKDFALSGGSFTSPTMNCTIGEITTAEFKARPLKMSVADMIGMMQSIKQDANAKTNDLPPEDVGKIVSFYADLFDAIQSTPTTLKNLDCTGTEGGVALKFSMGPMVMGEYGAGKYPSISTQNIKFDYGGMGTVDLASLVFKGFDLSGTINTLKNATSDINADWLTANARKLIPSFNGFGFAGLAIDMPNPDQPDTRIKAAVGDFDLTLANYTNAIPASIATSAHHIVIDLPKDSNQQEVKNLIAMGLTKIDAGYDIAVDRDVASNTITVKNVSINDASLGTIALSGTLGNAVDALFGDNTDAAMMAAMGLTLKNVKFNIDDEGMINLAIKASSNGQQIDNPAALRAIYSGVAQGMILQTLGQTEGADALGAAVGKFLGGAKSLMVSIVAKDTAGLGLDTLAAAQNDPSALTGKIAIDASAK